MKTKPQAIALFCGAGGLSLGFKRAGFDIPVATDADRDAVRSYARHFPKAHVLHCDIRDLDLHALPSNVDVLIGGPPCQGFSSAGPKFWADPRNRLLGEYIRVLHAVRPKWFLMENVEGLLTAGKGQYVCEAVKAFLSIGYSVTLEKIYAHAYGIPQRRKRVFLVGNRIGHVFKFPEPPNRISGRIFRNSDVSFIDAVSDLPPATTEKTLVQAYNRPPATQLQLELRSGAAVVSQHFYFEQRAEQLQRIRVIAQGQSMKDIPTHLHHCSFSRRANRRVRDGTPSESRGGAPSGIKRLVADEPALTITGAAMREFIHPIEDRPLSLRECARLQTFPDTFNFCGTPSSSLQQVANAVPPLLAEVIAQHILHGYGLDVSYVPQATRFSFRLTEANGMSPALAETHRLLSQLVDDREAQLRLFEASRDYILS